MLQLWEIIQKMVYRVRKDKRWAKENICSRRFSKRNRKYEMEQKRYYILSKNKKNFMMYNVLKM